LRVEVGGRGAAYQLMWRKKLKDAKEGLLEREGAGISVTCEA
jgi:hypothetical protein